MKTTIRIIQVILLLSLLTGCFPAAKNENTMEVYYTSAAGTISVALTTDAMQKTMDALARPSATAAPTDTPTDTLTPLPTDTALPVYTNTPEGQTPTGPTVTVTMIGETPTETPGPVAMVTAKTDTACRSGAGYTFPIKSSLLTGQTAAAHGRLADNTWWYIVNPADSEGHCWVWAQNTSIEGNIDLLPVKVLEPTPKPVIPDFVIMAFAYPTEYVGKCPVSITVTGYITVKQPEIVKLEWMTSFGTETVQEPYWGEAKEAGRYTTTRTIIVGKSVKGDLRLKLEYPTNMKSDRVDIKVKCTNRK
jgi:hypothetical protein